VKGCESEGALCRGALDTYTASMGTAPYIAYWTITLCKWHYREWQQLCKAMGYREAGE